MFPHLQSSDGVKYLKKFSLQQIAAPIGVCSPSANMELNFLETSNIRIEFIYIP